MATHCLRSPLAVTAGRTGLATIGLLLLVAGGKPQSVLAWPDGNNGRGSGPSVEVKQDGKFTSFYGQPTRNYPDYRPGYPGSPNYPNYPNYRNYSSYPTYPRYPVYPAPVGSTVIITSPGYPSSTYSYPCPGNIPGRTVIQYPANPYQYGSVQPPMRYRTYYRNY